MLVVVPRRDGTQLRPRRAMRRQRHGPRSGWARAPSTGCPAASSSAGRTVRRRHVARPIPRGGSRPARPSTRRRRRSGCRRRSRRPTRPLRCDVSAVDDVVPWAGEATGSAAGRVVPAVPSAPCPGPRPVGADWTTTARPGADHVYESLVGSRPDGENGSGRRRCRFDWVRGLRAGRGPDPAVFASPAGDAWGWPRPVGRRVRSRRAWWSAASAARYRHGRVPAGGARPTRGGGGGRSGPGRPPGRPGSARCRRRSRRGGTAWPGGDAPCGSRPRSPRAPRRAPDRGQGSGASSSEIRFR